ncbi:hypothetical protein IAT40_004288 [Kwoniella sp. CBS 6097]
MSSCSSSTSKSEAISPDYCAEDADLTLVSEDNTLFKVHSYMLKANSLLFRDMLCDKSIHSSLIPIAATDFTLTTFLNLMYLPPALPTSTGTPIVSINSWPQAKAVIELCDKYDCPFLIERICIRLRYLAPEAPWEIFRLASQYDQVQLAETALEHLHRDEKRRSYSSANIPMDEAKGIALPYLFALLDQLNANPLASTSTGTVDYTRYSPAYIELVWKGLARAFKPRA